MPFYTYIFWSYLGLEKSIKWIKTICITSVYWWQHLFLLTASWLVEIICGYQVIILQRSVIVFSYKASQTLQWIFFLVFCISWFIPCRNTCTILYRKLQIWSHLLKKSLIEKLIFCTMVIPDLRFVVVEKTLKACYILKTVKKPIQAFFNCFKNSNPLKTKN